MTMKVNRFNNVLFKSSINSAANYADVQKTEKEINELGYVTPDFGVKTPQRYTKTGIDELPNGLKLYSYKLANGYRVSIIPMEGSPAVVKTYVNVGSLNETPDIKGISHFLEHMAFNGTNGEDGHIKLETGDSFKKIDELGGWANASTNYAMTDYVNSSPLLEDKDLETQIRVLGSMMEDLKLSDEMIAKEKGPVSSEINMIMDDPQTVAMDQTVRTLFNIKNPADELVGGSVKHIQNLTRKDVMDYYNKYYAPENTNIVITGDVNPDEAIKLVSKNFVSTKKLNGKRFDEKLTPINKTVRKDFITDKGKSAEIVFGFVGPANNNAKEKILFNIASNYIDSQSVGLGKNLKEYNASYGINSERITTKTNGNRLIYLGITASEENSEKVLHTVYDTINSIKPISQKELARIKEGMEEGHELNFEYSTDVNNIIGKAVLDGHLEDSLKYNEILNSITAEEVDAAVKKYFDLNKAAITVVHPQKKPEISFKGKPRKPINEEKISQITLDNNFDAGFYNTKSPTRVIDINLETDVAYSKKAGVRDVLNEIYSMGTKDFDEKEFNKIKEDLNLNINTYAGAKGIGVNVSGNNKNYKKGLEFAKDLIYNPRITEETLEKAKERIKEGIERSEVSAGSLYHNEFYSKYSNDAFSDKEILNALDSITIDDVKEFHKYVLENSKGILTANLPENDEDVKTSILKMAEQLPQVKPNTYQEFPFYKEVKEPVVLTQAKNNSQADIKQIYNFKYENSLKNKITSKLMNSILSGSSIGLFDILREKEHLAYAVHSDISTSDDWGEATLSILTTTDNKDIGEQSYENVQRSIDGFKRQIGELIDGKFTEDDLENAKRYLKANLLENEGAWMKTENLKSGLESKYGITYLNKLYSEIDTITKEDIMEFAKNAFSGNPVYSITATQDTLEANKEFLTSLSQE